MEITESLEAENDQLAKAWMRAKAERDALAAVIEQAKAWNRHESGLERFPGLYDILAVAVTDSREADRG